MLRNKKLIKLKSVLALISVAVVAFGGRALATNEGLSDNHSLHITTDYIDARVSLDYAGFEGLSLDSLGKEHFPLVAMIPPRRPWPPMSAQVHGSRVEYRPPGANRSVPAHWSIEIRKNEILLESHWSAKDPPEPLVVNATTSVSHVTLLGLVETNGSIPLPAIMHIPDQGSFQITAHPDNAGPLGYATTRQNTEITFPAATRERPNVIYRLKVTAIYPKIPGIAKDPRFDGFRRNWLGIFQINPQRRVLSNNAGSDTCGFCYYEYADIAEYTPPLGTGVMALDMVRQTLDRVIAGMTVYGMPGYSPGHVEHWGISADTWPSFLIAAEDYIQGSHDNAWLTANYHALKSWADEMLATDRSGDGLTEYSLGGNSGSWPSRLHPSNWWDTIGFGHEDAYANALAYRALLGMAQLAKQTGNTDDQTRYQAAADKLKSVYFKTFYNPSTGVLAGWRSADGQIHDYYFLWVNGIAIHYGLVPRDKANAIMDRLLAKMNEAGFTNFALGLPGNLIPVARKDYASNSPRWGAGKKEDGSDGFQIYENGGTTACFAYFTVAALYDLGRIQDGDRILLPMLGSFAKGDFQGFADNKMSKDWKMWNGEAHGYEGLLVDNYYALLAVLDREKALREFPQHE